MKRMALRTTLTLSYAAGLVVFLTALALACYHLFARQLDVDATTELTELTSGVHGYLRFHGGMPALEYDRNDPEEAAFIGEATRYYQVYEVGSGRLLAQSDGIAPLGLHYTPAEVRAFVQHPTSFDIQTDRHKIRLSNTIVTPARGETYLVQVGVPLDARDAAVRRLLVLLARSLPVGLIAVLGLGRWMAGRALAPIRNLAAGARTIGLDNLHRRLPERGAGDELDVLAQTFNEVVARLECVVADMRQFSAAMAHEIRTPLTALRADIERSMIGRLSPDEQRVAAASQLEEIDKLTRLLAQLLTLSRADAGELPVSRSVIDLRSLASAVVETLEPVAQAKGLSLRGELPDEDVRVVGDAGWIERLLLNLVDNAIKFTEPGGAIVVRVRQAGGAAMLTVRDSGIGIASEALPHIFERFYRADLSRSPATHGAGLGLSLVKWIADRHRATVDVASQPGRGSTFTITVPASAR